MFHAATAAKAQKSLSYLAKARQSENFAKSLWCTRGVIWNIFGLNIGGMFLPSLLEERGSAKFTKFHVLVHERLIICHIISPPDSATPELHAALPLIIFLL